MFLGSEQWGNSDEVVVNLEDMARGALTLQVNALLIHSGSSEFNLNICDLIVNFVYLYIKLRRSLDCI